MGLSKERLVYNPTNGGDQVSVYELTLLSKAEDSAHTSGDQGIMSLAVRNDAGTSLVSADGDYSPLSVDSFGRLRVLATGVTLVSDHQEDAVFTDEDFGSYVLSVREDVLATSTTATGDYQSFKTDALGRLYMNEASQTFANSAVSVTNVATDLVPTDLVNRKRIIIQNNDNKAIFVGDSAVTSSNGVRVSAGSSAEFSASEQCDLYAITASGNADVRVLEFA